MTDDTECCVLHGQLCWDQGPCCGNCHMTPRHRDDAMAEPVPHYRDITPADTARDRMYTSLGRLADTMRRTLYLSWIILGISIIAAWHP